MTALDLIDRKIVAQLMRDATQSVAQIADQVGLSSTPCWKRIRRLESDGVIERRVALASPQALGLGVCAVVILRAPDHSAEWRERLGAVVAAIPEIMEVWRVAGENDYLLRIAVADMAAFDQLCQRLAGEVPIREITSHLAIERVKFTTAFPVDTIRR
ncbi:Lrp/AsnC family transcriptional regulator [Gemmobacter nectariphilus]|uniref:Lrp/AsnC family transcriptional regulator n=1 Tax=Gemmobacter nectariphilus TaxID=220343 RepID=UPI000400E4FC|nr:Lrp/AsnC family transcriptional regulator [Gemmobacter nectariphilus]